MRSMAVTQENGAKPPFGCVPKGGMFLVRLDLAAGYQLKQYVQFLAKSAFVAVFPRKRAGTGVGECKHKRKLSPQVFAHVSTTQQVFFESGRDLVLRRQRHVHRNVQGNAWTPRGAQAARNPKGGENNFLVHVLCGSV